MGQKRDAGGRFILQVKCAAVRADRRGWDVASSIGFVEIAVGGVVGFSKYISLCQNKLWRIAGMYERKFIICPSANQSKLLNRPSRMVSRAWWQRSGGVLRWAEIAAADITKSREHLGVCVCALARDALSVTAGARQNKRQDGAKADAV